MWYEHKTRQENANLYDQIPDQNKNDPGVNTIWDTVDYQHKMYWSD